MQILVTGGAGFIGSNYVKNALSKNQDNSLQITVLDKLTYAGSMDNLVLMMRNPNFKFVQGDICDEQLMCELVYDSDRVINFAAESHVDRSINSSEEFIKTNILGTHVILEAVRKAKNTKFIQVSTDEVYGSIEKGSWDENFPLKPNSPYAASKAAADLLVLSYQRTYSLDLMISRCCNNYGPNQFPEKIIPLFITNLLQGKRIPVYGNGKNSREWIHVDDHCRGLDLIFELGRPGEIYNLGSHTELQNIILAQKLIKLFDVESSMIEFVADRLGHDKRYRLNFQKASNELGFEPKTSFESGLENTINWYQENYNWWKSKV